MGYCERPFARGSPPFWRAQAHTGANNVVCAPCCVRCLRARPCGGFALLRFMPVASASTRVLPRSHILLAHALWRGRSLCSLGGVPCWGLLWACLLAGGWGLVFAFGLCSLGVFAFGGVGALAWGGGTVWSRRPLALLACLRAHASGVGLLACALLRLPLCGRGRPGRGGTWLSRPLQRGVRCPRCVAWREGEGLGALSWCANTRAHRERRGGGESPAGPCWPGWGRAG